jgi:hypothetical protein
MLFRVLVEDENGSAPQPHRASGSRPPTARTSSRSRCGVGRNSRPPLPAPVDSTVLRTRNASRVRLSKRHARDRAPVQPTRIWCPIRDVPLHGKTPVPIRTVHHPPPSHYPCNTTIPCESLDARNDLAETDTYNREGPRDTRSRLRTMGEYRAKVPMPASFSVAQYPATIMLL